VADEYLTPTSAQAHGITQRFAAKTSGANDYYRPAWADAAAEANPDTGTSLYATLAAAQARGLVHRYVDQGGHHALEVAFT
jgi:hypothetical protein